MLIRGSHNTALCGFLSYIIAFDGRTCNAVNDSKYQCSVSWNTFTEYHVALSRENVVGVLECHRYITTKALMSVDQFTTISTSPLLSL